MNRKEPEHLLREHLSRELDSRRGKSLTAFRNHLESGRELYAAASAGASASLNNDGSTARRFNGDECNPADAVVGGLHSPWRLWKIYGPAAAMAVAASVAVVLTMSNFSNNNTASTDFLSPDGRANLVPHVIDPGLVGLHEATQFRNFYARDPSIQMSPDEGRYEQKEPLGRPVNGGDAGRTGEEGPRTLDDDASQVDDPVSANYKHPRTSTGRSFKGEGTSASTLWARDDLGVRFFFDEGRVHVLVTAADGHPLYGGSLNHSRDLENVPPQLRQRVKTAALEAGVIGPAFGTTRD